MKIDKPFLFIEISDKKFIFLAVKYDESFNFKVLYSGSTESEGVLSGKIIDIEKSSRIIKDNLSIIEKKIGFIFKNATVISDQVDFSCINVSGFKKLGGSQILDEDISYILNNIKNLVLENEKDKSLVHLFNSNFVLDDVALQNPPIGLHGEFYNQHLTFFLLQKKDIKNIKSLLNNCHLNIERIISKPFLQGLKKMNNEKREKAFVMIDMKKNKSNISVFSNLSFIYFQKFNFGTDIIMRDISKVCSLNFESVKNIFSELKFDSIKDEKNEKYLDKKYFQDSNFRKISLSHLEDIILARSDELVNLIYKKNINLKNLKNKIEFIYLSFEDYNISENLHKNFEKIFLKENNIKIEKMTQDEHLDSCLSSAELIGKGWEKEAIPIIQTKTSIISRIFSVFFK